jgi:AbrB family looped-hinge helix DNA binding protein
VAGGARPATVTGSANGMASGEIHGMVATIDAAGRIVVPKALRDALGLKAGTRLEVSQRDGAIVIQPAPVPMRLVSGPEGPVPMPEEPLPTLTAGEVRAILESGRR